MNETLKPGFRQTMTSLHTWGGLIVGWVLYFIFLTGTIGYFDAEIDRWAQPELPNAYISAEESISLAQSYLGKHAPNADNWNIGFPNDRDYPALRVSWFYQEPPEGIEKNGQEYLNLKTGEPYTTRDTDGGQVLYRMHYNLHYLPRTAAHYLVGIATMLMLIAIITGIVIHRKIFKDFFTFRPNKNQSSWLEMHNMLSVLALPFHLMITYSGLLFFAFTYVPGILVATYGMSEEAFEKLEDDLFPHEHVERAGESAPLLSFAPMLKVATDKHGEENISSVRIEFPGDINSRVTIWPLKPAVMRMEESDFVFSGVTGERITNSHAEAKAPVKIFLTMLGLHEGHFADTTLRWIYFLSGMMGTAMIAAGLVLWSVKRNSILKDRNLQPHFGHHLVEVLNISTVVGLPVGIAAFFLANRLLPLGMEERHEWEIHALFITWLALLIFAWIRPAARAWTESLWVAAAAFTLIPFVNAMTTERHFFNSIAADDWVFASVDLVMLAFGFCFALGAWYREKRSALPKVAKAEITATPTYKEA